MSPPNPIKPIQEALERVLRDSGLHDFGRSMSSIDDLTDEVRHVSRRVDDIERTLETIVPILERLTIVFEDIQSELEPMSTLASRIPGSGSRRRRRRRRTAAALGAGVVAERGGAPRAAGTPPAVRRGEEAPGTAAPPVATVSPSANGASPGASPPAPAPSPSDGPGRARDEASSSSHLPAVATTHAAPAPAGVRRPGATGYAPLGSKGREDR